ncbi:MAG: glycosyltransferase family 39 protein [Candidatus Pacebacteria bacterium]|nr:glycosyltransferase family 39 protein [Candidatus Paceibacterota bacterium]
MFKKKKIVRKLIKVIFRPSQRDRLFLVLFLQFFFIVTRFLGYRNPVATSDYGNHLLISKYMVEGKVPYREFSLTHMPGLYWLLRLGFLVSDSVFWPFLFYVLVVSLVVPGLYFFTKTFFKEDFIVLLAVILFLGDPLLTLYAKVVTFDCLALVFIVFILLVLGKKTLLRRDYLLLALLFSVNFLIKITAAYYWAFFLFSFFVVYYQNRVEVIKVIKIGLTFFFSTSITLLALKVSMPELLPDILSSHLLRPAMSLKERLFFLFHTLSLSPVLLLLAFLVAWPMLFLVRDKKVKHRALFFLVFFIFSVFIPRHFYQHHLITVLPIGLSLVASAAKAFLAFFNKQRMPNKNFVFSLASLTLAIFLTKHTFYSLVLLAYNNLKTGEIYERASKLEGKMFANNNFFYMITGKEPHFWYFVTIPDGPCRWGNSCYMHQKILASSDYALLDSAAKIHILDPGFYQYLYSNFYLDSYEQFGELSLYLRR